VTLDQVTTEPRKRLHPLSPLLRGARALVVIVAALSWQTLSQVGFGWFAVMVVVLVIASVIMSVVSWYNTGYHVVGRELRVHEGLLWRRTRAIPLERLQAVEVVRPLLAQLTGLAELRLEVVGGGKTEAPLAFLKVADAVALRERLLTLAGRVRAAEAPDVAAGGGEGVAGAPPAVPPPASVGRLLHAVGNRDLMISQLLTPQALALPVGIAFVIFQFGYNPVWSFIGVASTLTAIAGVILQPVRRILGDWNFRLGEEDAGLRVSKGLTETRVQTVPLDRLQGVAAVWPLLWRGKRWLRLTLDVAGYGGPDQNNAQQTDRLLPVGDPETAQRIVGEVLDHVDLYALPLTSPPSRARWVHPFAQPVLGAGLAREVFATRDGLLTRRVVLVPYARIQSVRVVQGPLQRRLRLATVYADTAGQLTPAAADRDVDEAWALAAELATRARAARGAAVV
jgi:putative membrane protein